MRKAAFAGSAAALIDSYGDVYTWGYNCTCSYLCRSFALSDEVGLELPADAYSYPIFGDNTAAGTYRKDPTYINIGVACADLIGGENSFAVISVTGVVYVWGANYDGSLFNGEGTSAVRFPYAIPMSLPVHKLAMGFDSFSNGYKALMVTRNATSASFDTYAWGTNSQNLLLLKDAAKANTIVNTPTIIDFTDTQLEGKLITSIAAQSWVTAFVSDEGELFYAMAVCTIRDRPLPFPVLADANFYMRSRIKKMQYFEVQFGGIHALDENGGWWFWGDSPVYEWLGQTAESLHDEPYAAPYPIPTPGGIKIRDLGSTDTGFFAVTEAGGLLCLGQGWNFNTVLPAPCYFSNADNVTNVAVGTTGAVATVNNGTMYWIAAFNSTIRFSVPTRVGIPSEAVGLTFKVVAKRSSNVFFFYASNGDVYVGGKDYSNDLCEGLAEPSFTIRKSDFHSNEVAKLSSHGVTLALLKNGSVLFCYYNGYEIFNTSMITERIVDVFAGQYRDSSYLLGSSGTLYGYGSTELLGIGDEVGQVDPAEGVDIGNVRDPALYSRKIRQIVAGTYATWVYAPLDIDSNSAFTTSLIPVGATKFTLAGFGFGRSSAENTIDIVSTSAVRCNNLSNGFNRDDVLTCLTPAVTGLAVGQSFSVTVSKPALLETSGNQFVFSSSLPSDKL